MDDTQIEIKAGLSEGDQVVTTGAAALREGDKIILPGKGQRQGRRQRQCERRRRGGRRTRLEVAGNANRGQQPASRHGADS